MIASPIAIAVAAFLLGAFLAWLWRSRDCDVLQRRLLETQHASTEAATQLAAERAGLNERLTAQFQSISQQTLAQASGTFLELAAAKLNEERQAVKSVVTPVAEEFEKFTRAVADLQKNSAADLGSLKTSLEQVTHLQAQLQDAVRTTNHATGELKTALQNPRVAGSWGEIALDRIVELAGMTEHCDFDRQMGVHSLDGTLERPDMIVNLTGGMRIPVDAKCSAVRYMQAAAETDSPERARLLKQSAGDLKGRITDLRARAYDRIDGYAGMTFLFVPNESMLSSALGHEPGLLEEAARHQIVICSPLLLLCYLKAFAGGWRIQKQQDNAQEVARRGKQLHDRLLKFFGTVGDVGRLLERTVNAFNESARKVDGLLVPGRELGKLLGVNGEFAPIDSIDTAVREISYPLEPVEPLLPIETDDFVH